MMKLILKKLMIFVKYLANRGKRGAQAPHASSTKESYFREYNLGNESPFLHRLRFLLLLCPLWKTGHNPAKRGAPLHLPSSAVRAANDEADFEETDDFCEVFGKPSLPSGLRCGKVTNIEERLRFR